MLTQGDGAPFDNEGSSPSGLSFLALVFLFSFEEP